MHGKIWTKICKNTSPVFSLRYLKILYIICTKFNINNKRLINKKESNIYKMLY